MEKLWETRDWDKQISQATVTSGWDGQHDINMHLACIRVHRQAEQRCCGGFRTLPISEVHDTTIVLGMVVDSRMREVMLMGRLGLFGSTPFLVGGRYPCRKSQQRITYDSEQPV